MNKRCTKCKIEKPLSDFHKNKRNKDGRKPRCKECRQEENKIYRENNLEKERERGRVYRESNPEKIKESVRTFHENNPEKNREYIRKYREKHPEADRLNNRKRRARKLKVKENYTPEMETFVRVFFGSKCYNCGTTENLTHDHHLPLSRGHALEPGNAVLLCLACNSSKGNKLPKNFYPVEQLTEINTLLTHQAQLWSMGARIGK